MVVVMVMIDDDDDNDDDDNSDDDIIFILITGLTAFDYIVDFEEWIESGYFSEEIKARLKGMFDNLLILVLGTIISVGKL
jgi:hypothetical protein